MTRDELVAIIEAKHKTTRFYLQRNKDISGVSGVGIVADGVQFEGGPCVMKWRGKLSGIEITPNVETMLAIHGHEGSTVVVWVDEEESE